MKVLILGSGGREHALAWKLSSEIGRANVFIATGNGGTAQCGTNVDISIKDFPAIADFCKTNSIDIVLPGSEDPIALGVRDYLEEKLDTDVFVVSPDKLAAELEGSKSFAKEFMMRHNIPTAAYGTFTKDTYSDACEFLDTLKAPYVLKADGLAAGKGVLIIDDLSQAKADLKAMFDGKFGEASSKVVIEEFLDGIEFSVFALTDGENYVILPEAKDYKRIGEGDSGLNTGGMGAVSPVPFYKGDIERKTIEEIIEPTIQGFAKDGYNYRGFVFFGLINCLGQPKVIEYNVRMGDPETEVVIPRLNESLSSLIEDIRSGRLKSGKAQVKSDYCTTVFAVSGGYPEGYKKGLKINFKTAEDTLFHAGTKIQGEDVLTSGGRVLAATAFGSSIEEALSKSYAMMETFEFEDRYFRKDIGQDLLKLQNNGSI
ncbi:phosphoribosylamine--glycine ligase [bacterium]|nr:phosphoribosylamine--glycine ligase [bacterium]